MFTFAVVVLLLVFLIGILQVFVNVHNTKATNSIIDSRPGFENRFVSSDGNSSIAIDRNEGLIHLSDGYRSAAVTFDQLISSEVVQNGTSVTKTNRGSMIGRALVGGVLTGGVGAVIGGVTASKTNYSKGSIELQIITAAPSLPFVSIGFLQSQKDQNSSTYKFLLKEALKWHGEISAAIKLAENTFHNTPPDTPVSSTLQKTSNEQASLSIADQLERLVNLKNAGHITLDDLNVAKSRILGVPLAQSDLPQNSISIAKNGVTVNTSVSNQEDSRLNSVQLFTQTIRENIRDQRREPSSSFWIDVGATKCVLQVCSADMLAGSMFQTNDLSGYKPGLIIQMCYLDENERKKFDRYEKRYQFVDIGNTQQPLYCCYMGGDVSGTLELALDLLSTIYGIDETTDLLIQAHRSPSA